jgi:hypothetical protein
MALADEIAELEEILNAGVASVASEGTKADYDLAAVRKRLADLRRQQSATARPRCAQINLGGGS